MYLVRAHGGRPIFLHLPTSAAAVGGRVKRASLQGPGATGVRGILRMGVTLERQQQAFEKNRKGEKEC